MRLFIHLTNNLEWCKLSPARIHEIVVEELSIWPTLLGMIKPFCSTFALGLCSDETQQGLLKAAIHQSSFVAKLEAASNWTPIRVLIIWKSIQILEGRVEVTKEILSDEIDRVSLVRPASLRDFGRNSPGAHHGK